MSRTVFLVNPASGNGSTRRRWPELAHAAGIAGLTGETWTSTRPGEIADLAARAAAEGVELVVVVGGDGTLNEAVNGLLRDGPRERLPELAVLASGTGQDFVRTYGIPTAVEGAARVALEGRVREIDAGRVEYATWEGARRTAWFANVASAGMSGAVAQRANSTSKALGGRASFFWALVAVFARWRNTEVVVGLDGGEERRGPMHDVIVANGQWHGGSMWLAPEAQPDDGLFDVLLIGDVTKADFVRTAPKLYRGKHLSHPKVDLLRSASVAIDAPVPLPIETDGEQIGTTPARFEIVPRALKIRVPS